MMAEPWMRPHSTSYGTVSLMRAPIPVDDTLCYLFVAHESGGGLTVVGYLTVQDPSRIDRELRRPQDPHDLRVGTVWVHPQARGHKIGRILGAVAKQHRLFESHSLERTPEGTAWAQSIGDNPPSAEHCPDPVAFERGATNYYELILQRNPSLGRLGKSTE